MIATEFIIALLKKNLKLIIAFVLLSTIVGGVVCLLLPKYYASSTVLEPANPKLTDKNFVYGNGSLELNGAYGMEEDADRLLTQLRLSSNFGKLVDSFKLIEHYNIKNDAKAKANAQEELVQNSMIAKTETGAVKVSFWDKDKELAAQLTNTLVYLVEQKAMTSNQVANTKYITQLQQNIDSTQAAITAANGLPEGVLKTAQLKVLQEMYEKNLAALQQLKLSAEANVPTMLVLEKAYASQKADKPKLRYWLAASFFASLFFIVALLVFLTAIGKTKTNATA